MNKNLFKKHFKKDITSLSDIFDYTARFFTDFNIGEEIAFCINLAVEEVFTNMVKYNTSSQNDILISLDINDKIIEAMLIDYDVENFKLVKVTEKDMDDLRDVGSSSGRGVYLVNRVVDKLHYEFDDNNYVVKLFKKME